MNDNKELNDNLQRLFSTIKDAYGIASMIKDIKEKTEKPPLGLKPLYIHNEQRLDEVDEAIDRYNGVNKEIPKIWLEEKQNLETSIAKFNRDKRLRELKDKEVAVKDYEIISFTAFDGKMYYNEKGVFSDVCERDTITLVRRISDNEEFSVKDTTDEGVIKSFFISENKLWVRTEEKGGVVSINDIEKVKEKVPSFKDYNGNEIYEGDKYWYVKNWKVYKCTHACVNEPEDKMFVSEDKAKEYIYHNKPILSYNDAVHWLASDGSGYGLYEIVKEKIDKQ